MALRPVPLALLILWLVGIIAGFACLLRYASTPGERGPCPERWPAGSSLRLAADRPTLVLLAHPHCFCTQASLDELEQILIHSPQPVSAHVLFYRPGSFPKGWEKTALWHQVERLAGARAHCDEDGAEARLFGATTSGQVLLYHPEGHLLFRGGITNARGHVGASVGTTAILALLSQGPAGQPETPVFGCPLHGCPSRPTDGDAPCRR
jgi:hypothetical protein